MKLYHVTPLANLKPILHSYVSPKKSLGKRQVIWLVDYERIPWALSHVSFKHRVSVDDLVVLDVDTVESHVKRSKWPGVFTADCPAIVNGWNTAGRWFEAEGFNDERSETTPD